MKQILVIVMILNIVLFKGCSRIGNDESQLVYRSTAPQIMFDKIISALDSKDNEELKSLFSQNALEKTSNIDEQLISLMDLYQGNFVSNSHFDTGTSTGHQQDGIWVYMTIRPDIKELVTDKAIYSLRFTSVPANDEFPNDVGLWYIVLGLKDEGKVARECTVGSVYPNM